MTSESRLELKIGTFMMMGILILVVVIFSIKDVRELFRPRQEMKIVFDRVTGIKKSSAVKLSGIDVGEVKKIELFYNETLGKNQVEVDVSLDKSVQVREDFQAVILSLGLLGEKYIEIIPGTQHGPLLGEKDRLIGYVPPAMEEVTESGQLLMEQLRQLIGGFNEVIGDQDLRVNLKKTLANSGELTAELRELVHSLNQICNKIETGEGTIGRLIYDDALYDDIRSLVQDVKKHPWKLLWKTKDKGEGFPRIPRPPRTEDSQPGEGGYIYRK